MTKALEDLFKSSRAFSKCKREVTEVLACIFKMLTSNLKTLSKQFKITAEKFIFPYLAFSNIVIASISLRSIPERKVIFAVA